MTVIGPEGGRREAGVEPRHEGRQEVIVRLRVGNVCKTQFLDEPILKRAVHALHPSLSLTRVGAQDLDVEFSQGSAELRHALATLRLSPGDSEHRVLVRVESHWPTMGLEVTLESLEVGESALGGDKAQLHQPACGIVDKDQERAGWRAVLEPAMRAAIDLDQLAQTLAP